MTYEEVVEYILDIPKFAKKTTKENLQELLRRLGNPHLQIKTIHVAGTNGKGSTCAFIGSILQQNGDKVGMFTSPHLVRMNERIKIDQDDISDREFVHVFKLVKEQVDVMVQDGYNHVSFFEILFVMATLYFAKKQVAYGIFETGIGGRLDATVLLHPEVCVITSIGKDHMEYLGNTLEAITSEKAGIIKLHTPVVYLKDNPKAERVIIDKCYQTMSQMFPVYKEGLTILTINQNKIDFSYQTGYYKYEKLTIFTYGIYQIENAALAINTVRALIPNIAEHTIIKGLAGMTWPGRMELIEPGVLVDGAHNEEAIEQFIQSINKQPAAGNYILLFAAANDKNYQMMIKNLISNIEFSHIVITTISGERGIINDIAPELFGDKQAVEMIADIDKAYHIAKSYRQENDLCVCVGSLYLVGHLKQLIDREPGGTV